MEVLVAKKLQSLVIFIQACTLLIFAGYICFFKEFFQSSSDNRIVEQSCSQHEDIQPVDSEAISEAIDINASQSVVAEEPAIQGLFFKKEAFISLTTESSLASCEIKGALPSWLQGTFYLTGPAQFDLGQTTIKYWFNGLAMLHSFSLSKENVSYKNAFLKSDFYNRCMKEGRFDQGISTGSKKPSFFSKLGNVFKSNQDSYDNANLAIWQLDGQLCALTETPEPVLFDPHSLATGGHMKFNDKLDAHMATAQPLYDSGRQCWYNLYTKFGTTTTYSFCRLQEGTASRVVVAEITTKLPSYIRSFAMTPNYLVLIETPYVVRPIDLLTNPNSFIDNLRWEGKRDAVFTVVHKDSGDIVGRYTAEAFFMFNAVNAFEVNDGIHIDVAAYKDATIIKKTEMPVLRSNNKQESEPAYLYRFMLDLKRKKIAKKQIGATVLEMPEINKAYGMYEYTYCYGLSSEQPYDFHHQIVKMDVKSGKAVIWQEPGCFPTKPTFVPNPAAQAEDDGVVLSVVFDSKKQTSALIILQADTLKQIARVELPHHIPLGLSGNFYNIC